MVEPIMKSGICPFCGSSDMYSDQIIPFKAKPTGINTVVVDRQWIVLDTYVCTNCGYTESYIMDKKALHRISETWPLVNEQKTKLDQ